MKYKSYSSYKDSTLDWLKEIPLEWSDTRVKFVGKTYGGLSGKVGKDFGDEENPNSKRFIPFTNIASNEFIKSNDLGYVVINDNEEQNKVKKNDLFFLMSSENYDDLGKSSLLEEVMEDIYLNSFCKGFRLNTNTINPKFLNYLLSGDLYRKSLSTQGNGFTRINLRLEKLNDLKFSYPSLQEQKQIADFLSKATSKIDKIIEKQTKLIELLKEKRQAVISHAVTKGLDSNVPMKNSGVEWLGDIPEHWETKKLKFISNVNSQSLSEKYDEDFEINYIDIGSVTTGHIQKSETMKYSEAPSRARRIIENGDILISTVRTYLKAIAPVTEKEHNYIASTGFAVVRPKDSVVSSFLKYSLLSNYFVDLVEAKSVGVSYPAINSSDLIQFNIAFPIVEEQEKIANYLDDKTSKIDSLISKSNKAIELLKEKRIALISSAVTGKIDVRKAV